MKESVEFVDEKERDVAKGGYAPKEEEKERHRAGRCNREEWNLLLVREANEQLVDSIVVTPLKIEIHAVFGKEFLKFVFFARGIKTFDKRYGTVCGDSPICFLVSPFLFFRQSLV